MESYCLRAAEIHEDWQEYVRDIAATNRKLGIDCHAVIRELHRCMKQDVRSADEAMHILAQADPRTWGQAETTLESAWESLDMQFLLWAAYAMR